MSAGLAASDVIEPAPSQPGESDDDVEGAMLQHSNNPTAWRPSRQGQARYEQEARQQQSHSLGQQCGGRALV